MENLGCSLCVWALELLLSFAWGLAVYHWVLPPPGSSLLFHITLSLYLNAGPSLQFAHSLHWSSWAASVTLC